MPASDRATGMSSTPSPSALDDTASFRDRILPRRHPLRWVASIVFIAVVAGVVIAFSQADISWPSVGGYIASSQFLFATLNVILLAVLAQGVAIVLGLVITMMRTSRNPVAAAVAWFYVWIFRGVPLLLQIILWYNLALVLRLQPRDQPRYPCCVRRGSVGCIADAEHEVRLARRYRPRRQ